MTPQPASTPHLTPASTPSTLASTLTMLPSLTWTSTKMETSSAASTVKTKTVDLRVHRASPFMCLRVTGCGCKLTIFTAVSATMLSSITFSRLFSCCPTKPTVLIFLLLLPVKDWVLSERCRSCSNVCLKGGHGQCLRCY